jgi:hypothetical protein
MGTYELKPDPGVEMVHLFGLCKREAVR